MNERETLEKWLIEKHCFEPDDATEMAEEIITQINSPSREALAGISGGLAMVRSLCNQQRWIEAQDLICRVDDKLDAILTGKS